MTESAIRVGFDEMQSTLETILQKRGFDSKRSEQLAYIFAENSLMGKDSHGINRFQSFLDSIEQGVVKPDASPEKVKSFQAIEQWDGNLGPGPLNAIVCTDRAIELSDKFGIGCVALKNSNHWMRGGTYGWHAAERGHPFICWSNTKPNMPAWGSTESRLGNNPLIIAIPREEGPVVLDMAMTQYAYGTLEVKSRNGEKLTHDGGFDLEGNMTNDPDEIITSQRPLPAGLWKGSGLALVLDLLASVLSEGRSTCEIGEQKTEYGLSQVFIAFKAEYAGGKDGLSKIVDSIIADFHGSQTEAGNKVYYPGERSLLSREDNLKNGVPVNRDLWESLKKHV
ncbi:MAG TPA: 3-dehydro-L-gulonate 2-dehydrogenase [Balneolales bacterium]|nr:3-dehydro-L-gulonate 2-dehydrogenase [Balneolales bacterium]